MILRLTAKLAKKIKEEPAETLPADPNPFMDWTARLFVSNRVQYILFTNTAALYSVVFPAAGVRDVATLMTRALDALAENMRADGLESIHQRLSESGARTVQVSKSLNKQVTGSMNDLEYQATCLLVERQGVLKEIMRLLNGTPMTQLKYAGPTEAFRAKAER